MRYTVLTPMARIGEAFRVGDLIEIPDKAEAQRMIAAGHIAPISGTREVAVETADLKPVGVEKAVKTAKAKPTRKKA